MCICYGDFCCSVFSAVWAFIQTIPHLIWTVWGTHLYECQYQIEADSLEYFYYLTYFYTSRCINATLQYQTRQVASHYNIKAYNEMHEIPIGPSNLSEIQRTFHLNSSLRENSKSSNIVFPPESAVARRTYHILKAFMVLDSLWIIASFALIVWTAICQSSQLILLVSLTTKIGSYELFWLGLSVSVTLFKFICCDYIHLLSKINTTYSKVGAYCRAKGFASTYFFFPWPILLLIILFFDAIASVWYGMDIRFTTNLENWFYFIGGTNQTGLHDIRTIPKYSTTLPSVFMMLVFSRFIIIWLINLCLFFRIVQVAVNAAEDDSDEDTESKDTSRSRENINNRISRDGNSYNFQVQPTKVVRPHRHVRHQINIYSDTEDEEDEQAKQSERRYSRRLSRQRQSDAGFKLKRPMQNLKISGGYEGDRSNSPSPLPKKHDNPVFCYSSGYESSGKHSVYQKESTSVHIKGFNA